MIQTITVSDFRTAFHQCGRGDQFSYEALGLIFDYIEDCERELGEQVELDPIAICCEWSEDTHKNIANSYGLKLDGVNDDDDVFDYVSGNTVAFETSIGTIIYIQF